MATVTAPNLTTTTNTYIGRATQVTVDAQNLGGVNPPPQTNTTLVDAKGHTVKVWNADNVPSFSDTIGTTTTTASLQFALDGFGRMLKTTLKGQTKPINAGYDALGHQTALNDPDKGSWTYVNDVFGRVTSQTDARTNVTNSTYDHLSRLLTRTTTEANSGPVETANFYYYDSVATPSINTVALGAKGWIGAPEREESSTANGPGYAAANSLTKTVHYYDAKGRPNIDLTTIDGKFFYTYTDYDAFSRVNSVHYFWRPAGDEAPANQPYAWQDFGYFYTYDGSGSASESYLISLTDSLGRTWWDNPTYDYMDRLTSVRKAGSSGYTTTRIYNPPDGLLTAIQTTAGGTNYQNLTYTYDGLGNLTSRTNALVPTSVLSETYGYDVLNRLIKRNGGVVSAYDGLGNITSKTDVSGKAVSSYAYGGSGPHAVTAATTSTGTVTMGYDANGNLFSRTNGSESWSLRYAGFDKPRWMAKITGSTVVGSEFLYNANRSRTMQLEFDHMSGTAPNQVPDHYVRKRIYALGSTLEINYKNPAGQGATPTWNLDTVRIYVPGPDGIIGAREFRPGNPVGQQETPLVYHYDHLGSIDCITSFVPPGPSVATDSGGRPGRFSEDAWGQRRNPFTWSGAPQPTGGNASDDGGSDSLTPRGFTGHEMLDDLGLVHMNGRIYDPLLGRFLSADVQVTDPMDLQCYNRYTYVRNNPLSLVDPSGFADETPEQKAAREAREKAANAARIKAEDKARSDYIKEHGVADYLTHWSEVSDSGRKAGDQAADQVMKSSDQAQTAPTPNTPKVADAAPESRNGDKVNTVGDKPSNQGAQGVSSPASETGPDLLIPLGAAGAATHVGADAAIESGRFAMDGKIYKAGLRGNKVLKAAEVREAKALTKGLLKSALHAGVAVDVGVAAVEAHMSGYSNRGIAKSGMGLGFTFVAAAGGPPGWVALGVFVVGDVTGLLDSMFENYSDKPRTKKD